MYYSYFAIFDPQSDKNENWQMTVFWAVMKKMFFNRTINYNFTKLPCLTNKIKNKKNI